MKPIEMINSFFEHINVRDLCINLEESRSMTLGGFKATCIVTDGGEGDGAPISKVFRLVEVSTGDECLFRCTGTYNSWDESYWDNAVYQVEPFEVTITRYREVSSPVYTQGV
jgi:hypothetical protein